MSVFSGPAAVTSGLVFGIDMNNTQKSWRGKPTTNTFTTLNAFNGLSISYVGTDADGWQQYSISGTWNSGTYPYSMSISSSSTFLGNTSYSAQMEIRTSCSAKFAAWGAINYVNDPSMVSGGTQTIIDKGYYQIWKRENFIYSSGYAGAGGTSQVGYLVTQPVSNGTTFNSSTDFVYIRNVQIEQNTFCTAVTTSSRTTSNALIDLSSNKNSITTNSLTYNSDGTYSFDGSSNYVDVTSNLGTMSGYTFCHWSRRDAESKMPIGSRSGSSFYQYGDNSWAYTHGGTWGEYYYPHAVSIPTGTWGFYSITYDGSNVRIYRNGTYEGSQASTGTADFTGGVRIGYWGAGGAYWYQGAIASMYMYNRALSQAEITQMFRTQRKRYGV